MSPTTDSRRPAIFGTDGIRGVAGEGWLSAPLVERLGRVLGVGDPSAPPVIVAVGRDTRPSGPELSEALTRGLVASGAFVMDLGVLPTPALAAAISEFGVDLGAMISASHNPAADNGIKLFTRGAEKIDEARELAIEDVLTERVPSPPPAALPGRYEACADLALGVYRRRLIAHLEALRAPLPDLTGMKVVVDCAEGALSAMAAELLGEFGCNVSAIHAQGRGAAINDGCGALHPESLAAEVRARGAEVGAAFDGDADRVILVDASGAIHHGDAILYVLAADLHARGRLPGAAVVGTVMSNLGLELALGRLGIGVRRTQVGDRFVTEAMKAEGLALGGEQAGHIVIAGTPPLAGDGLLAALHVMATMRGRAASLEELVAGLVLCPQVLLNVPVRARRPIEELSEVGAVVQRCQADLGARGRVLLRYSGTEPKLRVMVEALAAADARRWAESIAETARRELA